WDNSQAYIGSSDGSASVYGPLGLVAKLIESPDSKQVYIGTYNTGIIILDRNVSTGAVSYRTHFTPSGEGNHWTVTDLQVSQLGDVLLANSSNRSNARLIGRDTTTGALLSAQQASGVPSSSWGNLQFTSLDDGVAARVANNFTDADGNTRTEYLMKVFASDGSVLFEAES
ncbi:hypothetical protein ACFOEK_21195, partial [Litoribrevibacter euphylliae]